MCPSCNPRPSLLFQQETWSISTTTSSLETVNSKQEGQRRAFSQSQPLATCEQDYPSSRQLTSQLHLLSPSCILSPGQQSHRTIMSMLRQPLRVAAEAVPALRTTSRRALIPIRQLSSSATRYEVSSEALAAQNALAVLMAVNGVAIEDPAI
jgi:hypothetical protein